MTAARNKSILPKCLDEKMLKKVLAHRELLRKKEFEQSLQLNRLKVADNQRAAKSAGVNLRKVVPEDPKRQKVARSQLLKFKPGRSPWPAPLGFSSVYYPPYSWVSPAPYEQTNSNDVEYVPWNGGPNRNTGQIGSILAAWGEPNGSQQASCDMALGSFFTSNSSGVLNVRVNALISGIYRVYSSGLFLFASCSLDLYAEILYIDAEPAYPVQQTTNIVSDSIMGGVDWNYIGGVYSATVSFNVWPKYDYILMGGTTQKVFCQANCSAAIDAYTTILSIDYWMS